jgi:acetyl esterase/lipase
MRDSGFLRGVIDGLIYFGLPELVQQYPHALGMYFSLPVQTIRYGDHPMQTLDILSSQQEESKGLVVLCHGGAWGSGRPWMYRLTACPFLNKGYTVAIWGYRTWPDAGVDGQVDDLKNALQTLQTLHPSTPTTLVGHSSGAHVAVLGVLRENLLNVDHVVSIAGVYDIPSHYEYETGRGVEQISALQPACGHVRNEWQKRSPTCLLKETKRPQELPNMLFLHGAKDTVVPYTSAVNFHQSLRHGRLTILPTVGHAETVLQLMMGGETQDVVMAWLEEQHNE